MRLIYIYLGGSSKGSSVQNKINCQIRELNNNGWPTLGWFFNTGVTEPVVLSETSTLFPLMEQNKKRKYFNTFFERQYYYSQISKKLDAELDGTELVFLRHGDSGPAYEKLLSKNASRLVLYIPSNSIAENYQDRKHAGKTSWTGFVFRWVEYYFFFYRWEKRLFKRILPKLKAVVVFTPEFAKMIKKKAGKSVNVIYNRDGADCSHVPLRNPSTHGEKVKLLFMKGSSTAQPWSGLDRLIDSIENNGRNRFQLYITGTVANLEYAEKSFVTLTGRLNEADLEQLVNEMDLGVSNLANYLIHFQETTNLKSREYFARGLPFIQANSMPDVDGTDGENYYLRLTNDASLIDMDVVEKFAIKMRNEKNIPGRMRQFAEQKLDWSVTVAELAHALKKL